jgi:hypothetical protein
MRFCACPREFDLHLPRRVEGGQSEMFHLLQCANHIRQLILLISEKMRKAGGFEKERRSSGREHAREEREEEEGSRSVG